MKRFTFASAAVAGLIAAAGVATFGSSSFAQEGIPIPAPVLDEPATGNNEVAVFAGGCFWGVQGVFQHVDGVKGALSGYSGGNKQTAHYHVVGSGETGHAEAVQVTFDPSEISYGKLLQIYFSVAHDPTELNRQGPDTGTQYRSTIFPQSEEQAKVAAAYIGQLDKAKVFDGKIVTTIEPGHTFYPAEGYHQNYLTLNPTAPYIVYNDMPKVANLERLFPADYRADPVLVPEKMLSN